MYHYYIATGRSALERKASDVERSSELDRRAPYGAEGSDIERRVSEVERKGSNVERRVCCGFMYSPRLCEWNSAGLPRITSFRFDGKRRK